MVFVDIHYHFFFLSLENSASSNSNCLNICWTEVVALIQREKLKRKAQTNPVFVSLGVYMKGKADDNAIVFTVQV